MQGDFRIIVATPTRQVSIHEDAPDSSGRWFQLSKTHMDSNSPVARTVIIRLHETDLQALIEGGRSLLSSGPRKGEQTCQN